VSVSKDHKSHSAPVHRTAALARAKGTWPTGIADEAAAFFTAMTKKRTASRINVAMDAHQQAASYAYLLSNSGCIIPLR
jgi:hypothetical protein